VIVNVNRETELDKDFLIRLLKKKELCVLCFWFLNLTVQCIKQ